MLDTFKSIFSDAFTEQQVWKTQIDLTIFQDLMDGCNEVEALPKTRYIKLIPNPSVGESSENEESEQATGGSATAIDEPTEEPIFLETTV